MLPTFRTLTVVALCSITAASFAAGAWAQSAHSEPGASDEEVRSRAEAVEMGDQRQRETLRGPFREEMDRTRDAEEPETDGFEPRDADEYD